MSFLAPMALFGVLAAAAPIIIHLLNRRKFTRIPWAAMDFLLEIRAHTSRRLRLEEVLLLVVRTLAILLVALAAGRPVVSARRAGGVSGAVILVDKSASMAYTQGAGTLFDSAKARTREVLSAIPDDTGGTIVTFDSEAEFPFGQDPSSGGATADAIAALAPGWCGTDYSVALAAAERASKAFPSPPAVFLVSDFREGGKGLQAQAKRASAGPLYLVPVADSDGENLGLSWLGRAGEIFTAASRQAAVTVVNATGRDVTAAVSLTVDGAPAGTTAISAPAGARVTANVPADALGVAGTHLVEVSVPADGYDRNDHAWAVIARRALDVGFFAEGDARKFLAAALASAGDGAFAVRDAAGAISGDGFIVGGEAVSAANAAALWGQVREGAFMVVFLDAREPGAARAFLEASGDSTLGAIVPSGGMLEGKFHVEANGAHAVTGFLSGTADMSISSVEIERILDVPVQMGENVETPLVVPTPSGAKAFLTLARVGRGRIAIFNTAADRSSGNFAVTPFYVPLLFECIAWARGVAAGDGGFVCGESATLPVAAGAAKVEIDGPEGVFAAERVATPGGAAAVFTPKTPGFYRCNGATVAVNVPAAEADLRLADVDKAARALGATVLDRDGLASAVSRGEGGREISTELFAVALCLLAMEMALVYYFKRQ